MKALVHWHRLECYQINSNKSQTLCVSSGTVFLAGTGPSTSLLFSDFHFYVYFQVFTFSLISRFSIVPFQVLHSCIFFFDSIFGRFARITLVYCALSPRSRLPARTRTRPTRHLSRNYNRHPAVLQPWTRPSSLPGYELPPRCPLTKTSTVISPFSEFGLAHSIV